MAEKPQEVLGGRRHEKEAPQGQLLDPAVRNEGGSVFQRESQPLPYHSAREISGRDGRQFLNVMGWDCPETREGVNSQWSGVSGLESVVWSQWSGVSGPDP